MSFLNEIKERALAEGLESDTLLDTVLHRTFVLAQQQFQETLDTNVGQDRWHQRHREAIKQEQYTGEKYDPDLDILQIKKAVLEEIRRSEPGVKVSIRTRRPSSMSLDVLKAPYALTDQEDRLTAEGLALGRRIEKLVRQYNFDHGDSWTDYFSVNFHANVTVDGHPIPCPSVRDVA